MTRPDETAAGETSRRLYVYNGGFLTQGRVRRILELSGYDIRLGKPGEGDLVGVWGQSPTSPRGAAVAERTGAPVLRVEDAFLRSVLPGRAGGGPGIGLLLDRRGVHFDPSVPSDLEHLLATDPLDDTALLNRARDGIARLKEGHLTKYTGVDPALPVPEPGYVLVIDQTEGDASVSANAMGRNDFLEMLFLAREAHPAAAIVVKAHPETALGARTGHLSPEDLPDNAVWLDAPVSPWALLEGAVAVYTVSSQLGFEAILAGHRPVVMGQPFYAGWGLTDDRRPLDRRQRRLTRAQLFAGAMILAPTWYDPLRDRLATFEEALAVLEAETRAWREDRHGWVAGGMRLWKRRPLQRFFGGVTPVRFRDPPEAEGARRVMSWAGRGPGVQVEDGVLRSAGLGAELVPPLSLVLDDLGIYYDPDRPSRLEHWIARRETLRDDQRARAEALIRALTGAGLTKYNLSGALPEGLPEGHRILVPGQVEDDASLRLGGGAVATNRALLEAVRAANPGAVLLYKPHPDVEAGLRPGRVEAEGLADVVLARVGADDAMAAADAVWTMTSTLGFEALLRGLPVTCLGRPFYAGWGLTRDQVPLPRRTARPGLAGLVHAVLIDYPRYLDPVTGRPCPVEVAVARLASGAVPRGAGYRVLAKLQGLLASRAWLWR